MSEPSAELREQIESTIRLLAVDAVEQAKSGHPGAPMGLATPALQMWDRHLRFDPNDPEWPLRDRFVLSAGHASMLLYSLLHLYGYDVSLDDIRDFRQLGSKTPGHPEYGDTPGVEVTTGPLGQGFAHGVGMALAARMTRARFGGKGKGPGHHTIYGIVSDGDLMEGISYEAGSLAGHLGLGNIVYLYDDNKITIDGGTDMSFTEDVARRFEAQRWHVQSVDGLDADAIDAAISAAKAERGRPSLILCRTTIGYGSPNKGGTSGTHGAPLGADEVAATKKNLGWSPDETFHIPAEVKAYLDGRIGAKKAERKAADADLESWREARPAEAAEWDRFRTHALPDNLLDILGEGMAEAKDATRKHSGAVLARLAELAPFVIGGSADLAGSNNSTIKGGGDVGQGDDPFAGRNLHFGVREHAMGAITNGIALDGTFQPYAATFLIFSDYVRPSIRLASIMGTRSIFIFTHDSIFVGEDGPTHQPIEQLDSLRAIPRFLVWRPADGLETAAAWAWLVQHAEGPGMLALTRQGVPPLDRPADFRSEDIWKGGYLVRGTDGDPDVILAATGSEVGLACKAADKLSSQGIAARVVSLPCLELLAEQPEDYRRTLLPSDRIPVIAIEAGRGQSLEGWVGDRGLVYGIRGFGASGPAGQVGEQYGFAPGPLVAAVTAHLEKVRS
jgi:transketolase